MFTCESVVGSVETQALRELNDLNALDALPAPYHGRRLAGSLGESGS